MNAFTQHIQGSCCPVNPTREAQFAHAYYSTNQPLQPEQQHPQAMDTPHATTTKCDGISNQQQANVGPCAFPPNSIRQQNVPSSSNAAQFAYPFTTTQATQVNDVPSSSASSSARPLYAPPFFGEPRHNDPITGIESSPSFVAQTQHTTARPNTSNLPTCSTPQMTSDVYPNSVRSSAVVATLSSSVFPSKEPPRFPTPQPQSLITPASMKATEIASSSSSKFVPFASVCSAQQQYTQQQQQQQHTTMPHRPVAMSQGNYRVVPHPPPTNYKR
jgi:hypothetical protein